MEYPELFGALDCRIRVPPEAIEELRMQINLEEGPKSKFQAWPGLTEEFDLYASRVFLDIGAPKLTMGKGWDVFVQMAVQMALE